MRSSSIKESFIQWATRRQQPARSSITLNRKRIFILPTRYGLFYAVMLFVMLMGAIHYSNSMAFLLTFLLAGLGSIAMWQTHRNLLGLRLEKKPAAATFVGQDLRFPLIISNDSGEDRFALALQNENSALTLQGTNAHDDARAYLLVPAKKRGWINPGRFRIYTRFPLGLFQAWSWLEYEWTALAYPRPVASPLPINLSGSEGEGVGAESQGTEDFSGLREYRPGDSSRHIAWKTMAHTDHPMTKQFSTSSIDELWLDWSNLDEPNPEMRLSMLTYQVLEADRLCLEYGLRLPGKIIPPGLGEQHKHNCLMALALHQ
jgi:uncharacterized protein (DUF58 family)